MGQDARDLRIAERCMKGRHPAVVDRIANFDGPGNTAQDNGDRDLRVGQHIAGSVKRRDCSTHAGAVGLMTSRAVGGKKYRALGGEIFGHRSCIATGCGRRGGFGAGFAAFARFRCLDLRRSDLLRFAAEFIRARVKVKRQGAPYGQCQGDGQHRPRNRILKFARCEAVVDVARGDAKIIGKGLSLAGLSIVLRLFVVVHPSCSRSA